MGYGGVHVEENDTGPDDCNHAQHGAFVLAGPGVPELGELRDTKLLDVAPTLLEHGGWDVPAGMQGMRSCPGGASTEAGSSMPFSPSGDDLVRERLKGLGYLG